MSKISLPLHDQHKRNVRPFTRKGLDMKFFKTLSDRDLFGDYAEALDWFLWECKFEVYFRPVIDESEIESLPLWDNKNRIAAFTRALHKMEGFSENRFFHRAKRDLDFPQKGDYRRYSVPTIFIANGSSEGRDWIRHIRNGIAHGHIEVYDREGSLVLEILDFGKPEDGNDGQTSYMLIPLSYLNEISKVYHEKEESWKRKAFQKGRGRNKKAH